MPVIGDLPLSNVRAEQEQNYNSDCGIGIQRF